MARNYEIGVVRIRYAIDIGWRVVIAVVAIAYAVIVLCSCTPLRHTRTIAEQQSAAVHLRSICGSSASGVILDARTLLTAAHFPIGCPSSMYLATDAAGGQYYVALEAINNDDVARLRVLDGQPDLPSPGLPQTGRAAGRVCSVTAAPSRGRPCGFVAEHDGPAFSHTIPVQPGNSGSGVYDARGRLVGIVSACFSVAGVCTPVGGTANAPVVE